MKRILKQSVGIDVAQKELVVCIGRMYEDLSTELYAYKSFANVHAFVLLGASSIRRPRPRLLNVVTKDKNLFCRWIEFHQAGTKSWTANRTMKDAIPYPQ